MGEYQKDNSQSNFRLTIFSESILFLFFNMNFHTIFSQIYNHSWIVKIKDYVLILKNKIYLFFKNFSFAKGASIIAVFFGLFHFFCYWFPFTDNAFVVTNVSPVAADVSGFITDIYVKNGQAVKAGQEIFKVYQAPYKWVYQQTHAEYLEAKQNIVVLHKKIAKTDSLLKSVTSRLNKAKYELHLKEKQTVKEAVSRLEIVNLGYDVETFDNKRKALIHEIEVLQETIKKQIFKVKSLRAKYEQARINLDLTVVKAPKDGVIDNMYVSAYTPIKIHQPVFSFIDTSNYYIQANFNETDLRNVRPGQKVYIWLRMYYFNKLFKGEIVNTLWAAERQNTAMRSQLQKVRNENEWLLLPQRFPVQIKILNPDPNYPLHPGASAYVYIATH